MICTNCGTENVAGAKFCHECGQTFPAGCPNCGFANVPGAKFCSDCGAPLGAPASTQPRSVPPIPTAVAERRLVSVLFADLVGFTPFAEERDSEDVRETLTRYFDICGDIVGRHGGTIEKFIGDAVMAVWGAPTAHEDDAERAVRAALELVDAVGGLGPSVQARAGVLTGEAAVTIGATNQGMVAGDIVNTASRLQSVAPPGTVLVGEQTQLAAAAAIVFERLDDQLLKGKQAPVAAWRALRIVAERGGRNRAETLEAPFVGRTEELRLLKELFHATSREKKVRVVSVIGPGGIGKSRLAWEFLKYIDGLVEGVWWHSGRSPAYGEGISFWALGEMVRERCGLREGDDEATTRGLVAAKVAEFVTDADERQWIERALLTLLGVDSGMATDQLFGAWRTFFERLADQGVVVLVFEDMHFADSGLLDFVDHLLEWSRGRPIYVVTLARPDLIEKRSNWGAGKRNFNSLYLEPLSDEDMAELLAGLVPGLPKQAVAAIVGRADGIPLYAVETVRTLVAEGRLVKQGDVYVPQGDLSELAVPPTLTALISSRLDTLDEVDRRIVHDAAVLGQSFSIGALSAVAGMSESELEPRLDGLTRRELLQREMDPRSPERGQFEFVQALIREVAYNTLSKHDRKKLHLAAARHFESLGNEEIAGVLASHYLAAHANAAIGAEADALAAQARIALKAATARASALGSHDQAVAFGQQTLSITADAGERLEALSQVAADAELAGRWDTAEAAWREALELARERSDAEMVGRFSARLGRLFSLTFRPDDGVAVVESLGDTAGLSEKTLAELSLAKARLFNLKGDPKRSLALCDAALESAEHHGWIDLLAQGLVVKGNALFSQGRRREAFGLAEATRSLATEYGLTDVLLRVSGNIANGLTELDLVRAVAAWQDVLELARRAGQRGALMNGVGNFGYCAFLAGEWDAGLAVMDEFPIEELPPQDRLLLLNNLLIIRAGRGEAVDDGLAEIEQLGKQMSGPWHSFVADPEANYAMARGDLQKAHASFVEIGESDPSFALEYNYRAAHVSIWQGDAKEAHRLLERFTAAGGFGPIVEGRRQIIQAGIASLEGRPTEAMPLYREALRNFRSAHSVWDEALLGIDMAQLLDPAEPEVAAAIAGSREILERLQAKPYQERLDAAVAGGQRRQPVDRQADASVTAPVR